MKVNNNIFNFKDIKFVKNNSKFFSESIKIIKNKQNLLIEGDISNKDTILKNELLKFLNIDFQKIGFLNTNFNSISKFSFLIDKKFKVKNLILDSDIEVIESDYKVSNFPNNYFEIKNNTLKLKNHKIRLNIINNKKTINGSGKIKIQENFDDVKYNIYLKNEDFKYNSQLILSEFKLNSQDYLKNFITNLDRTTILKDQKINHVCSFFLIYYTITHKN